MNVWQKLCIVAGTIVIALMFLVFPSEETKTITTPGSGGVVFGGAKTHTETTINYKTTTLKTAGVASGTVALTVLLGFVPKKKG